MKPSPSPPDSGPQHQFRQQWRLLRMGTPCLSRPKEPSWSSLAGALPLLDSWRFPHSQALPSLASPTANVDRAESVCCPGSAAKSRDDHESAQKRPCDKFCSKNDWDLSQHLSAQSQRVAQRHLFPKLASFCTSSSNVTSAVAHQHHSRHHSCQWYRPTEEEHGMASVPPAPTDSEHHLILWTARVRENEDKYKNHESENEIMLPKTTQRNENTMCWRKNYTNSSQSGQEFAPVPQHTQMDTNSLAGDLSHWWAW